MTVEIRKMTAADGESVIALMRTFYSSPAVHTDGSEEIFRRNAESLSDGNPYAEGYVFDCGGKLCGYGALAKSYSTEFGKSCIWIEDIFVTPEYRSRGIGKRFIALVCEKYPDSLIRLEAESENTGAMKLYRECGFEILPYEELIKNMKTFN